MKIDQIVRIATFALMLVGLVMMIGLFVSGESWVGPFIQLGYFSTVIAVLATVIYSVVNLAKGGNAKNTLIGVGAVAVVLIISYAMSSGADFEMYTKGDISVSEGESKMVSAGLTAFYIFLFIAIVSILYTEVSKAFK